MKITIVGKDAVSEALKGVISARGMTALVAENAAQADMDSDLIILNKPAKTEEEKADIRLLTEQSKAPVAAIVMLEYVAAIAKDAADKSRVLGLRLMGEEFAGQYIELTKIEETDPAVYAKVKEILAAFNDRVAEVPDVIGGIFYRMFPLQLNVAAYLVQEGVTPRDVNYSMRYGANIKRPPMEIIDEIGLDYTLEVLEAIYKETGRPAYRPCPLLKKMVSAGKLGRKVGEGFFRYNSEGEML